MDIEKLNQLLIVNGELTDALVTEAALRPFETIGIASNFYILELKYSSANHSMPDRMVVKRPLLSDRGQGEADVYEKILDGHDDLPILKCFGVLDEAKDQPLSFLFEDLSLTHDQSPWPIIPSLSRCKGAVAALAEVHANWWGQTDFAEVMTAPVAAHHAPEHLMTFFPGFVDKVGEYLSPSRVQHFQKLFSNLNAVIGQRLSSANRTIQHTDSHFWNFLYPKDTKEDHCVIFDWPLWNTGLGGSDLAYMIALHLYPEHRHRFESQLLDHYRQVLNDQGVRYDRADVLLDYRIGILVGLLMSVMEFSWKIPPYDWIPKLEKALSAFDEHHCLELLDSV